MKQVTLTLQEVKEHANSIQIQIMPTDMAQNKFDSIYQGTCESLGDVSSPTGRQDLCPINTQITRIWTA